MRTSLLLECLRAAWKLSPSESLHTCGHSYWRQALVIKRWDRVIPGTSERPAKTASKQSATSDSILKTYLFKPIRIADPQPISIQWSTSGHWMLSIATHPHWGNGFKLKKNRNCRSAIWPISLQTFYLIYWAISHFSGYLVRFQHGEWSKTLHLWNNWHRCWAASANHFCFWNCTVSILFYIQFSTISLGFAFQCKAQFSVCAMTWLHWRISFSVYFTVKLPFALCKRMSLFLLYPQLTSNFCPLLWVWWPTAKHFYDSLFCLFQDWLCLSD